MSRISLQCDCRATALFANATEARAAGWIVGDVIRCPKCDPPTIEVGQVKGEVPDPPSMWD